MSGSHHFAFIDPTELDQVKRQIMSGDNGLVESLGKLTEEADAVSSQEIITVLDKGGIAPSGDKKDFWSIGAYSWPNVESADGLPYRYRDSKYNPEAYESREYDKGSYEGMVKAVKTLVLAWYFTGESRYSSRAADLLRAWFVDPSTCMRPNFRYAASRPGVFDGHHSGVIEGVILIELLDYAALLENSPSWSIEDQEGLRAWFLQLSHWLARSRFGRAEAATTNNHSAYYLAQTMAFAMFGGNHARARAVVPLALRQMKVQVAADGTLPSEIRRPNSFYYAVYGLWAFVIIARLSERYGEDVWRHSCGTRDAPPLARSLAWLAPYCSEELEWPLPRYGTGVPNDALPMFWIASRAYENSALDRVVDHLIELDRPDHVALVYPSRPKRSDSEDNLFRATQRGVTQSPNHAGAFRRAQKKFRAGLVVLRILPEGRIP